MQLRHLKSFIRIARDGSFSRAALALHIAQPALSQHIRQLEEELGVTLFVRHARGVTLSPAGNMLFPEAIKIIEQVASIQEQIIAFSKSQKRVEIRLGLPTSVVRTFGRAIAEAVENDQPEVMLQIVEGMTGFLCDWLTKDGLDIAIPYDAVFYKKLPLGLVFKPLIKEEFFLISSAGLKISNDAILLKNIQAVPLVLPRKMHAIRTLIDDFAKSNNIKLNVVTEVDSFHMLIEIVRSGGFTFMPAIGVAQELAEGVVEIQRVTPSLYRTLNIVYFEKSNSIDAIHKLVETVYWVATNLLSNARFGTQILK